MNNLKVYYIDNIYKSEWCLMDEETEIGYALGNQTNAYIVINEEVISLKDNKIQIVLYN